MQQNKIQSKSRYSKVKGRFFKTVKKFSSFVFVVSFFRQFVNFNLGLFGEGSFGLKPNALVFFMFSMDKKFFKSFLPDG